MCWTHASLAPGPLYTQMCFAMRAKTLGATRRLRWLRWQKREVTPRLASLALGMKMRFKDYRVIRTLLLHSLQGRNSGREKISEERAAVMRKQVAGCWRQATAEQQPAGRAAREMDAQL